MSRMDVPVIIVPNRVNEPNPLEETQKGQVFPASSISELVQSELASIQSEATLETLEDIGFAMGGRLRLRDLGKGQKSELGRTKEMLLKLIQQIIKVDAVDLDELLNRFAEQIASASPLTALQEAGLDSGQIALILAALLGNKGLSAERRKQLEDALQRVIEEEDWELHLFAHLEFGMANKAVLAQIKNLYQRASSRPLHLAQWLAEFKGLPDRRRKLKVLIRTLSFELSAQGQPVVGSHLAAVITDLKRILLFLGLEEQCVWVANILGKNNIDGDRVLSELLHMVDQTWLYAAWVEERVARLGLEGLECLRYGQRIVEIVKLMPEDCFKDADQRENILQAWGEYLDKLAEAE